MALPALVLCLALFAQDFAFELDMMQPAAKRARKSPVWEFMEQDSPTTVKCLICKQTLSYNKTTSSMMKHIQSKHPLQYAEQKENVPVSAATLPQPQATFAQQTLPDVFAKKEGYKEGGLKKQQLDKLLIKMIATDLQPISIVEDTGFRNFVHGLDPRYVMPSRRDLTRKYLPELYEEVVKQVQGELRDTPYVSLTTDLWTSRQTRGFITVTAHYITSEWTLKSSVLETARLKVDHTAENIADELRRICTRWEIMNKVCCIITDNAANIVAAVTKHLQIKQQPCFAHTLNLVVQDSIKNSNEIRVSQEKIKRIVSFFHHSVKATDKLCEIQDQNGVQRKKLIMDVDTRWNSTFYMMERFLEQHEAITTTLCLLGKSNMCLSSEELDIVKSAVLLLGPFEEATREMSTEKMTSLSKVIPIARALQQCINSNVDTRTGFGTELQKQMQKRFATVEKVFQLGAATLLDVRFKKVPFVDIGNVKLVEERIINLIRSEYSQEEKTESVPRVSQLSESHINEVQAKRGSLWQCFDAKVETTMKTQRLTSIGPHIELRRYLEEPVIPRDEDPLQWWKMHSVLFPKLNALAKKFLCIPATSVPSERLFSKAGELISHRRNALSDKNINMILFLNKNI